MTTFTPLQTRVLNSLRFYQAEYRNSIPYNIIKLDLSLSSKELDEILDDFESENIISRYNGLISLEDATKGLNENTKELEKDLVHDKPLECEEVEEVKEVKEVEEVKEVKEVETEYSNLKEKLSETELEAMEVIKKITDDSGNVSRNIMEGHFLYGEMGFSSIKMYNIVTSLENNGLIKKIKLYDGDYYTLTSLK